MVYLVSTIAFAQTPGALDPAAPETPVPATPNPSPTPAIPTGPTSAATVVDSNLSPTAGGALSAAAGPTPISGPGASTDSGLGDRLNSALRATRLPFRLTATLGEVYDNNIFDQRHKVGDFVTRFGVTGEYQVGDLHATDGNYFDALYNPSVHIYAQNSHEDGVDQNVDVFYGHHWSRLTLSLEQIYTKTQETDASVGGLVTGDVYTTLARANFGYSEKLDLVSTFKQQFSSYDQANYTDNKEWIGDFYALYHIDPKLSVGLGPRFGYLNINIAPDETFQQLVVHAIYVPNDRVNLTGAAGAEYREYQTNSRSSTLEPIFEFTGAYLPQPSTSLSVNASHHFAPSFNLIGNDYIATTVSLTAAQRFSRDYYLGLEAGYENDDYQLGSGAGRTREDNYYYVMPSLRWKPIGWLEVAAFDKYDQDSSNFNTFSYDTNQVGVSCSATY